MHFKCPSHTHKHYMNVTLFLKRSKKLISLLACVYNLFQTLMDGKSDKATEDGVKLLRAEMEKLKKELKTSEDGQCPCI